MSEPRKMAVFVGGDMICALVYRQSVGEFFQFTSSCQGNKGGFLLVTNLAGLGISVLL